MATGLYNKEGDLIYYHDMVSGIFEGSETSDRIDGEPVWVRENGDGTCNVRKKWGIATIYYSEQGKVMDIEGWGYAIYKDLLSRGWYVAAPVITLVLTNVLYDSFWDKFGSLNPDIVFCGLPILSIAVVGILRRIQSNQCIPHKISLEK